MLSVRNLSIYLNQFQLLSDINFDVEPSQITAILGANGAGKTSLIKAISGEQLKKEGQITLLGSPLHQWKLKQRALLMAVLQQHSGLAFEFSCLDVVMLGRSPHSSSFRQNKVIAEAAFDAMDISYLINRSYPILSGGEKQRVQLARVLAQVSFNQHFEQPRLLLLDEPISSLDIEHQENVLKQVRQCLPNNIGILMIIHDINHALNYSDKILLLHDGKSLAYGDTKQHLTVEAVRTVFNIETELICSNNQRHSFIIH